MISNEFFFHKQVEFEEMNMLSTMLDCEEKLVVIFQAAERKALSIINKKLSLHSLICGNITLKTRLKKYLSDRPADY